MNRAVEFKITHRDGKKHVKYTAQVMAKMLCDRGRMVKEADDIKEKCWELTRKRIDLLNQIRELSNKIEEFKQSIDYSKDQIKTRETNRKNEVIQKSKSEKINYKLGDVMQNYMDQFRSLK